MAAYSMDTQNLCKADITAQAENPVHEF